ncbi:MAG: alpha/beta hydrolase [Alphaproteobacteria bacterium]|nr:alpha/beta hydrolase [Alphaproteobacteria bacterium]
MKLFKPFAAIAGVGILVSVLLGACVHKEIPYPELEAKYAYPSSRYIELEPGLRVHYTDDGPASAPPIVMVHGFAASTHAWRPWTDRLSGDFRMISLDLPGHGLTRTPDDYRTSTEKNAAIVKKLIAELGLRDVVLAGNSMGGAVAWTYALTYPDDLDALILVNAAGWPEQTKGSGEPPMVFGLLSSPLGRALLKSIDPRLLANGGLKAAYLDETMVDKALIDRYSELALAEGHRDVLLTGRSAPSQTVIPETFRSIRTPTLVMAGEQDKVIPVAQQRGFAGAIPGAELIVYPNGGHVPMEQLPDMTAKDLKSFLDRLKR